MRVALLIEYDGTDFAGWQIQPGIRTVQQEIEAALHQALQQRVSIISAGRTDAGVHAVGMVAHAEIPDGLKITLEKLNEALNALTGYDVVIHDIREVPSEFHARYSALDREYEYFITSKKTALNRNFSWYVRPNLDLTAMKEVCRIIVGDHDFTSFSKRSDDVEHYRCIIDKCEIEREEDRLRVIIRANRFVRGMVRALVGAMVEVGKGAMTTDHFEALLNNPVEEDRARYLAPAKGLVFQKVRYPKQFGLWT